MSPCNFELWQHSFKWAENRFNVGKTKDVITEEGGLPIKDITGRKLRKVKDFKYLVSMDAEDNALLSNAWYRTDAAWCKKIPIKLKDSGIKL